MSKRNKLKASLKSFGQAMSDLSLSAPSTQSTGNVMFIIGPAGKLRDTEFFRSNEVYYSAEEIEMSSRRVVRAVGRGKEAVTGHDIATANESMYKRNRTDRLSLFVYAHGCYTDGEFRIQLRPPSGTDDGNTSFDTVLDILKRRSSNISVTLMSCYSGGVALDRRITSRGLSIFCLGSESQPIYSEQVEHMLHGIRHILSVLNEHADRPGYISDTHQQERLAPSHQFINYLLSGQTDLTGPDE